LNKIDMSKKQYKQQGFMTSSSEDDESYDDFGDDLEEDFDEYGDDDFDDDWDEDPRKRDKMVNGKTEDGIDLSAEADIPYDTVNISFSQEFLPKQLISSKKSRGVKNFGKITFSFKNGALQMESATKGTDFSYITLHDDDDDGKNNILTQKKFIAGNHDLVKSIEVVEYHSNYPKRVVLEFTSIPATGTERFFNGCKNVTTILSPHDMGRSKKSDKAIKTVLDRFIQEGVRIFLKRYPGQTPDNLNDLIHPNGPFTNVNFSPKMSCLIYFHNVDKDENGEYINEQITEQNVQTIRGKTMTIRQVALSNEVVEKYRNIAKEEMQRNLSFGDITSQSFAIKCYPAECTLDTRNEGFANFKNCFKCSNASAASKSNPEITLSEEYLNTPFTISGTIRIRYKKINSDQTTKTVIGSNTKKSRK
jgi:hypothetical protein